MKVRASSLLGLPRGPGPEKLGDLLLVRGEWRTWTMEFSFAFVRPPRFSGALKQTTGDKLHGSDVDGVADLFVGSRIVQVGIVEDIVGESLKPSCFNRGDSPGS